MKCDTEKPPREKQEPRRRVVERNSTRPMEAGAEVTGRNRNSQKSANGRKHDARDLLVQSWVRQKEWSHDLRVAAQVFRPRLIRRPTAF